jgi:hypothetical protein
MPTQGTSYYTKEVFPKNIVYIKDTPENRIRLKEFLGEPRVSIGETAYIEIDTDKETWYGTPDFQWLYRDAPPLHSIEEIRKLVGVEAYNFGNPITWKNGEWFYIDGKECRRNTEENYSKLICPKCKLNPTSDNHDPCIKNLKGVDYACCGHGINDGTEHAYIKFNDGKVVRFKTTEDIFDFVKVNELLEEDKK